MKASIAYLIAGTMLVGMFMPLAVDTASASATTYWITNYPCSSDAWTFAADYIDYSLTEPTPVDAPGVKVLWDGSSRNLWTSLTTRFVYCDTFTDTGSWTNYWVEDYYVPWFPPANATIYKVYIVAEFVNASHTPNLFLEYAIDGLTFAHSGMFYGDELGGTNNTTKAWDVTSRETWGNDTFLAWDFTVRMQAFPVPGVNYYLDYLGLIVVWEGAGGGSWGGVTGDEPTPWDPSFDIIYIEGGLILVLGAIGFVGMIAVPPVTLMYYRMAEGDRISAFVKALVAFVFCLTLFMVWVTAG